MLYQQFFTTIHDSLDLPYRHINRFCKPFVSQTIKQSELQNLPVTLGKYPLVNQIFPFRTTLAEIFCFHRLPLFDFSQSVASWTFLCWADGLDLRTRVFVILILTFCPIVYISCIDYIYTATVLLCIYLCILNRFKLAFIR